MTPTPISVVREAISDIQEDVLRGTLFADVAHKKLERLKAVVAQQHNEIVDLRHRHHESLLAWEAETRRSSEQQERAEAAERAREEATEDAATERALQRAAEKLPDGWEISVVVENGAGWVTLHDPEGELVEFEDSDRTIAQQVTEATDTAIAAFLAASGGA